MREAIEPLSGVCWIAAATGEVTVSRKSVVIVYKTGFLNVFSIVGRFIANSFLVFHSLIAHKSDSCTKHQDFDKPGGGVYQKI